MNLIIKKQQCSVCSGPDSRNSDYYFLAPDNRPALSRTSREMASCARDGARPQFATTTLAGSRQIFRGDRRPEGACASLGAWVSVGELVVPACARTCDCMLRSAMVALAWGHAHVDSCMCVPMCTLICMHYIYTHTYTYLHICMSACLHIYSYA